MNSPESLSLRQQVESVLGGRLKLVISPNNLWWKLASDCLTCH